MKKLVNKILGRLGLEIIRKNRPSQLRFQKILSLLDTKDLFFLEIGANDGKTADPIYQYVRKGIIIEPQPDIFEKLRENYSNKGEVILINKAIGKNNGIAKMYRVNEQTGLTSFNQNILKKNIVKLGVNWTINEIKVEVVNFENLLKDVPSVDVLQIDVEGYDYEIIKMFDFNKYRPKLIHYESKHLNRKETIECENYLKGKGYLIFLDEADTLAI
jgi:FkbM family methyltransferase